MTYNYQMNSGKLKLQKKSLTVENFRAIPTIQW